jgi:hypothetical protein
MYRTLLCLNCLGQAIVMPFGRLADQSLYNTTPFTNQKYLKEPQSCGVFSTQGVSLPRMPRLENILSFFPHIHAMVFMTCSDVSDNYLHVYMCHHAGEALRSLLFALKLYHSTMAKHLGSLHLNSFQPEGSKLK